MFIVARPRIDEETISPTRSKFAIEPLEPGFGYTLGNALRRTLLSSIPGAAISSVRIDGVLHEFSTIPKVTEDVTDIILNLKELVLSSENDEPSVAYLRAKGPADVTAGDIQPPAGVEILNPDLHLATLGRSANLELEMTIQRGVGYVPAERNKNPRDPIGVIPVDSIFSPVKRVTYAVENTRVEQMTDRDRLILDVETDGSISPRKALASAGTTLSERIRTTEAKAKALRPLAEHLITFAKRGDVHARRQVLKAVPDRDIVHKLFSEIGPRYSDRKGGYTRILKLGQRPGDGAPMALIE